MIICTMIPCLQSLKTEINSHTNEASTVCSIKIIPHNESKIIRDYPRQVKKP